MEDEIRTFEFVSRHGQGPRLLGRFSNGRVEEFIRARIYLPCSSHMKEFHDLDMPGPKKVLLRDRFRKWLNTDKSVCPPEEAEAFCLGALDEEISILEKSLSPDKQLIGFCHNDLQYGNIMIDEQTKSITIIDYEYSSYNPVAYDTANHFREMASDYHTETPHILDFIKYPGLEERKRFLCIYLSCSGNQPSDVEIEKLIQDVETYGPGLVKEYRFGLVGVQALVSIQVLVLM